MTAIPTRVYVASSWRNGERQQWTVANLRAHGYIVYDFMHPPGGDHLGFNWSDVDVRWTEWTGEQYLAGLDHPIAEAGFSSDIHAMVRADACVLVLPCGRSAHLEAGYFVGAGKPLYILLDPREFDPDTEPQSPHSRIELMYKLADVVTFDLDEILRGLDLRTRIATEDRPMSHDRGQSSIRRTRDHDQSR